MGGLFGNLVQASKALMAHQVAIQVTGRNLANVNNPEFARQRVKFGDRYVNQTSHGPEGTGVEVLQVQAMRDAFLDAQVVRQAADSNFLKVQKDILSNLELVLGDKIESNLDASAPTGVGAALDGFFNAFSALAANPSDVPTRSAALVAAQTLADRINLADERLAAAQYDQEQQMQSDVEKANGLLRDIARMNFEIRQAPDVENGGAVDLIDKRQARLEELSSLFKVDVSADPSNPMEMNISMGGVALVVQGQAINLVHYVSQSEAADLTARGTLGVRKQGFEVGQYDQAGNFTPAVASTGGASMLSIGDIVTGAGIPANTTITGKLGPNAVRISNAATLNGFSSLTISGMNGGETRMAELTAAAGAVDGKTVVLSNATAYQIVPGGGSAQARFQTVFGQPTATAMTAKGLRAQLSTLASQLRTEVNKVYNPADLTGDGVFFDELEVATANSTVSYGTRAVNVPSTNGLAVGMYVSGTGIPPGTTVAALLGANGVILSVPATQSGNAVTLNFTTNLLSVRSDITATTLRTAPTTVTAAGANTFASKIAALRDSNLSWGSVIPGASNFSAKLGDYSRNILTGLAQTIQTVTTRSEESDVINTSLKTQRDSVSGVSLDEETADLLRFQKAYQANAKVISVIDEMLQSLIATVR